MRLVRVSVEPLPSWLDSERLCGSESEGGALTVEPLDERQVRVQLTLPAASAADLAARLRGVGIDGRSLTVRCEPPLQRAQVRAARLRDARARRDTTPGFSLRGAVATGEGRFSLTPEPLALALGELAAAQTVLDVCCGSGGNSIGFARAGARVTAIELDPHRLAEAQHNARLYGVNAQMEFLLGDALLLLPAQQADLLFVDPPWGEHYDKQCTTRASFPLLDRLLSLDLRRFREIWLKLPSSFASWTLPGARASAWFGTAPGDSRRIKFLLLRIPGSACPGAPP